MNLRIPELAEQAEFSEKELHFAGDNFQKFAELIVRECADVATINQYQSYTVGHYVLKHFGVAD